MASQGSCTRCKDQVALCPSCGGSQVHLALLGVAGCRGDLWAASVARRYKGRLPPWPSYDESERVRAIALAKVADLEKDEAAQQMLARALAQAAVRRYEGFRVGRERID